MGITCRIFQLHQLLRKGRRPSLNDMMEQMEVSKATIKRDLELLRDQLGAPLVYDRHDNAYSTTSNMVNLNSRDFGLTKANSTPFLAVRNCKKMCNPDSWDRTSAH